MKSYDLRGEKLVQYLIEQGLTFTRLEPQNVFDRAVWSWNENWANPKLNYGYQSLVIVVRNEYHGISWEEAQEFVDYNTVRSLASMPDAPYITDDDRFMPLNRNLYD